MGRAEVVTSFPRERVYQFKAAVEFRIQSDSAKANVNEDEAVRSLSADASVIFEVAHESGVAASVIESERRAIELKRTEVEKKREMKEQLASKCRV